MARIAIDIRVTQGGYPGIGRATTCLVETLLNTNHEHQLLLLYDACKAPPSRLATAMRLPHRFLATAAALRSPADQWKTPHLLHHARADLFHSPYYAQPLMPGCPYVLTVFDLIPVLYPRYWPKVQGAVIRLWLRRATLGAAHVLAPSSATAADLTRLYGLDPGRITVAPLAADAQWLAPQEPTVAEASPDPYLLCVCSNKPHKNLVRLVEAYAVLVRSGIAMPELVWAGGWDERYPQVERAALCLLGATSRGKIRIVKDPDDQALRSLYRHALGFIFPSEYEGFGLPVLEAMLSGLPVAASTTPAVAEVAGSACIQFAPLDGEAISDALQRLAHETALREQLRQAGFERAQSFSWQATAQGTLLAYQAALATPRQSLYRG